MNRLLKGRGKILAALFMLSGAVSLPAWGIVAPQASYCTVTSGNPLNMQNVNVNISNAVPGTVLYKSTSHHIEYTCYLVPSFQTPQFRTNLRFSADFLALKNTMINLGLGVNIIIKEDASGSVTIPWADIKNSAAGKLFPFGDYITIDQDEVNKKYYMTVKKSADITLELFVENTFKNTQLILPVGTMNAIDIYTNDGGYGSSEGIPVKTSGFNIRILPDNLGKVVISPRLVQLGHFYTTDISKRSQPFTVTAQQANNTNVAFSVPLRIRFEPQAGLEMTADKTAVKIKNTGDANDNGLQLSIEDTDSGKKVVFGEDEDMGIISMGSNVASGQVPKRYVAVLDKIPGVPDVITGKFEVSGTVVVTYN